MLTPTFLAFALAATGFAQTVAPEGYRTVYISSMVDTKYVVVPSARSAGANIVVYVPFHPMQHYSFLQSHKLILYA
jgi:hypothetical protein